MQELVLELVLFSKAWGRYLNKKLKYYFARFEKVKGFLVEKLVIGRGKLVRPFLHSGMAAIFLVGASLAPFFSSSFPGFSDSPWQKALPPSAVLSAAMVENPQTATLVSNKPRAEIIEYTVQPGDTVSEIALKFDVSIDTIRWANDLSSISAIKPGQRLKILPVTGIAHKVKKGETVYSIAKRYSVDPQAIVDFPFNTFVNDETFALAVGQNLIVPDGIMPKEEPWSQTAYIAQKTPDAGTITATGIFVWPTSGRITQRFRWYHKAIDIANQAAPGILAADSGSVIVAGWPDGRGYGNRVVIDHGNGFRTLYAHLSRIYVKVGQTVKRGDLLGQMGSTGRSTGVHLHFEIIKNGVYVDPLGYLK